jgi:hypothetical protein
MEVPAVMRLAAAVTRFCNVSWLRLPVIASSPTKIRKVLLEMTF